jgi:hypothetical protein
MTKKEHEHKYTMIKVESCTLEPRESIVYATRQCTVCGLCPTTDFRQFRLRPEICDYCNALMLAGQDLQRVQKMLPSTLFKELLTEYKIIFYEHQQAAHPERMTDIDDD